MPYAQAAVLGGVVIRDNPAPSRMLAGSVEHHLWFRRLGWDAAKRGRRFGHTEMLDFKPINSLRLSQSNMFPQYAGRPARPNLNLHPDSQGSLQLQYQAGRNFRLPWYSLQTRHEDRRSLIRLYLSCQPQGYSARAIGNWLCRAESRTTLIMASLNDLHAEGLDRQSAAYFGCKDIGGFAFNRFDLFHQLWTIERAAIPKRSHEHRNLQWRYLHLTLADCLVNHIDLRGRVNDLARGFGDLLNAGGLAQTKGARHIGNVILAVVLEQGIANVPEIWIAGAHQTFRQGQRPRGNAIGCITFEPAL